VVVVGGLDAVDAVRAPYRRVTGGAVVQVAEDEVGGGERGGGAMTYATTWVYDLGANTGWVSVGTDHDTAAFAVATLGRWWQQAGRPLYPNADRLLVTADAGGSNGYRELARPALGQPVIVELIAATTTRSGLKVRAELDQGRYPLGVKISHRELAAVPIRRHQWHGEWNYTVLPQAAQHDPEPTLSRVVAEDP
jgi:Rhodopirellula transposase DDE domain